MGGAAAAATAGLVRAGSNTTLPPRSPAQQRAALQRTSSDDRPNPLPSPASGFRGRTVSPQRAAAPGTSVGVWIAVFRALVRFCPHLNLGSAHLFTAVGVTYDAASHFDVA